MLFGAGHSRDSLVGPVSDDPERAAFDNMGREDRVVVGLIEEDVVESEQKYGDVGISAVQIWDWDPDARGTSCDGKGGSAKSLAESTAQYL
jgi:hypothetical protein